MPRLGVVGLSNIFSRTSLNNDILLLASCVLVHATPELTMFILRVVKVQEQQSMSIALPKEKISGRGIQSSTTGRCFTSEAVWGIRVSAR